MSPSTLRIKDKEFVVKISSDAIQQRVASLAKEINSDYNGKCPLVVGVLTGGAIFTSDLFKHFTMECELTFIRVSSYHGGLTSSGQVSSIMGLKEDIKGRHVIIVEDIVDTGETAVQLFRQLLEKEPASLKMATMLFKPTALKHDFKPDYIGMEVAPDFLVGYGLDYDGLGRNLNDIYVLKP